MHQTEMTALLRSIQIAQPKTHQDDDGTWTSSIFKEPIDGAVPVKQLGLEGDRCADPENHGGVDKAILGYSADHLDFWQKELGQPVPGGGFGENLTFEGLDETMVCIGDRWTIGSVLLQVSQPRQPCWKLGRRWKRNDLPKMVVKLGYSGWYFRVLKEGVLESGQEVTLVQRTHPEWTVARASSVFYGKQPEEKQLLAGLDELAAAWKNP